MARTKQTLRKVAPQKYEQATFGHDLSNVYVDEVAEYATPDRKSKCKTKWLRRLEDESTFLVVRKEKRSEVAVKDTTTNALPIVELVSTAFDDGSTSIVAAWATNKSTVASESALSQATDPALKNNVNDIVWRYSPITDTEEQKAFDDDISSSVAKMATDSHNTTVSEEDTLPETGNGKLLQTVKCLKPRKGRAKTRSLICEYCDKKYKQRSGILRHLKKIHGLDAHGKPVTRPKFDAHPRYGGKYPPGVIWKTGADTVACCRLDKRERSSSPEVQPSRQYPVDLLIHELNQQPSMSNQELAETLGRQHGWGQEAVDIAAERLGDLHAERLDIAKGLPCWILWN